MNERERGRPTYFGEKMKQTAVYLTNEQLNWLETQPLNKSETIRNLIDEAMKKESNEG